jgi:hypothetical protein
VQSPKDIFDFISTGQTYFKKNKDVGEYDTEFTQEKKSKVYVIIGCID